MDNFPISREIVFKKVNEIRPYVRNPRINDDTVEKLVKIIPMVGFNVPIVVDNQGIIIKGHARFKAGIRLGMEEFPCIISEASDEQNKLDRISDNRISEFSEWLVDSLKEELHDIKMDISDLELEAYTAPDDVETSFPVGTEDVSGTNTESVGSLSIETAPKKFIKVICEKCGNVQFIENNKNVFTDYGDTKKEKEQEDTSNLI